ncbi:efflux RND transporter periplasmic adaptor subunit [Microvirga yunnanensis]|uniref:efflux RND transporter periplasmic adaptor subunit n=1 Tax=Microvirga yunnanensis TaxID=2953740 RepID=UPI0021C9ECD5|nr:efflux RND transporter periplasmic adaptor subunit [Microvirga sp. HBU65207]
MTEAEPTRIPSKRGFVWIVVLILALGGGVLAWRHSGPSGGAEHRQAAQLPAAVPVEASAAELKDIPIDLIGLGSVQAATTVTVRSRVDGQIQQIAFEEGKMVKEGDLLVQIDPRPFQAGLGQAQAKKAQDEAQLASAQADLARTNQLAARDFASQQQLDTQRAAVRSLQAQIQADQAAIDSAQTQLEYTTIRSPLTGRAGFRLIDQGNIVHAADQNGIVEIAQLEPVSVLFTASEGELPAINKAVAQGPLKVWALSTDGKDTLAEGSLSLVNNQVDTQSGTIRLKAAFENKDHALWPGQSVDTRLRVNVMKNVLSVPDTAVQRGPQGLLAYVVKPDNTVEPRPLKVGPITKGQAVIEEGLKAGEQVVTAGHYRLSPGARVEVKNDIAQQTAVKD